MKFLSPREKFLLIRMKLRSRHTDADFVGDAADVAEISRCSLYGASWGVQATAASLHAALLRDRLDRALCSRVELARLIESVPDSLWWDD
jgi:hypothetical protein